jgi:hypothetical protein
MFLKSAAKFTYLLTSSFEYNDASDLLCTLTVRSAVDLPIEFAAIHRYFPSSFADNEVMVNSPETLSTEIRLFDESTGSPSYDLQNHDVYRSHSH